MIPLEIMKKELLTFYRKRVVIVQSAIMMVILIAMPILQLTSVRGIMTHSLLNELLFPVLFIAMISPAYSSAMLAAYSFAGEKERKTLEHLLVLPIEDSELLLGKLAASFASGAISEAIVLGTILSSPKFLFPNAFQDTQYPDSTILILVFLTAPLVVLVSTLLVTITSAHVSSTREAYLSVMIVMGILLFLYLTMSLNRINFKLPTYLITIFLAASSAILYVLCIKSFNRERLITEV